MVKLITPEGVDYSADPLFSVVCNEPEGSFLRSVWPLILWPENVIEFYNKAKQFSTLYGRDISKDIKQFQEIFADDAGNPKGLFWVVDDFVGVYYLTDIALGHTPDELQDALVHYTFFDRRTRGRRDLTKMMISYVFDFFNFHRLSAEVPKYALKYDPDRVSVDNPHGRIPPFIESLGFKKEGVIRNKAYYKGQYFDVVQYGLTKEEFVNGTAQDTTGWRRS